jgi:hypothetical protein
MRKAELSATLDVLKFIAGAEAAMAEFYRTCAQGQGEGTDPWLDLEREERQHVERVTRMATILAEQPDDFECSRAFHLAAIHTFTGYVESTTERLRRDELPAADHVRLLSTAYDMEQSIIECKYGEIVRSTNFEYQELLREIIGDTVAHKNRLGTLLAAARKG